MAVTYGFYNSLNKDRMYNAEQMSSIFNGIITDGVFSTIGDALMTVAGTGMQVIVKSGRAWFNSTWTLNDAQLPLDVPAADVSMTRIDAVILEVNSAISARANSIKVLKGIPSANPTKPTLSATETLHQYALAYITVAAGVTSITAANIEINVGKTTCPFITSVLQQTDITDLFNQWEAEFTAWFENVQAQLSGNVAANLQRQIDLKVNLSDRATAEELIAGALNKWVDASSLKDLIAAIKGLSYDLTTGKYGKLITTGLGFDLLKDLQKETGYTILTTCIYDKYLLFVIGIYSNGIALYKMDLDTLEISKIGNNIIVRNTTDTELYSFNGRYAILQYNLSGFSSNTAGYAPIRYINDRFSIGDGHQVTDCATLNYMYKVDRSSSGNGIIAYGDNDKRLTYYFNSLSYVSMYCFFNPKNTNILFSRYTQIDNSSPPNFISTIITKLSISGTSITKLAESKALTNPYGRYVACLCPVFTDNINIYAFYIAADSANAHIYKRLVRFNIDSLSDDIPSPLATSDFLAIPSEGFGGFYNLRNDGVQYLGLFNNKHYVYYSFYSAKSGMLISIDPKTYQISSIGTTNIFLGIGNANTHISEISDINISSPYRYVNYQYIIDLRTSELIAVANFKAIDSATGLQNVKKHVYTASDKLPVIYLETDTQNKVYKDGGPVEIKFFQPEN